MVSSTFSWPQALEHLLNGGVLSPDDASALMEAWLSEDLTPVQTGAFLAALRARGVNGAELGAMASVLRAACPLPGARPDLLMVDTCGTGGDGADTFNISTAVASPPRHVVRMSPSTATAAPAARWVQQMCWKVLASISKPRHSKWWRPCLTLV